MRRLLAALSLLSLLAGCETSPLGGRCVLNSDCDRRTTGMTARCVRQLNPESQCSGGSMESCICCPLVVTPGDTTVPTMCVGGTSVDTGSPTDATIDTGPADTGPADTGPADSGTADTGPADTGQPDVASVDVVDTGAGCACSSSQFCDTSDGGMQCVAQRPIGATCSAGTECQTNHCVESVCCNSACTGAGLSCNVSPDFAGLCTPIASPVDAGE
jgi:hypothetical protein